MRNIILMVGANSEMGMALARSIVSRGYRVVMTHHPDERAKPIGQFNFWDPLERLMVDLSNETDRGKIIQHMEKHDYQISHLIYFPIMFTEEITEKHWQVCFSKKMQPFFSLTKALCEQNYCQMNARILFVRPCFESPANYSHALVSGAISLLIQWFKSESGTLSLKVGTASFKMATTLFLYDLFWRQKQNAKSVSHGRWAELQFLTDLLLKAESEVFTHREWHCYDPQHQFEMNEAVSSRASVALQAKL